MKSIKDSSGILRQMICVEAGPQGMHYVLFVDVSFQSAGDCLPCSIEQKTILAVVTEPRQLPPPGNYRVKR